MKIAVIGGGPAGLYFSLLTKKGMPDSDITIYERNAPGVTWGWGVVFSDETLENFQEADRSSYDAITSTFASWENIDIHLRGRIIRSGGHHFYGIRRMHLLEILQKRCEDLGVKQEFHVEAESIRPEDFDLVVAADGINSRIRSDYTDFFKPEIRNGKNRFIWLATTKLFDSFTFILRENEAGLFIVHAYPFDKDMSTFIVETDEETWRKARLDQAEEQDGVRYCENLFAPELEGNHLYSNRSQWIYFRRIKNQIWHHKNIVLIGDAAHTAHFSIGSGTKLAMEDSIALSRAMSENATIPAALQAYQENRWLDVAKLQRAADVSQTFFEDLNRWKHFDPEQLAFKLLCRSKRVTHGNLKLRDPAYIQKVDRWFADHHGCREVNPAPPPMFTPFRLRDMKLKNRVVVSPMCQYSAEDGTANDWHLVHLASRAIGGAALIFTEMTDVSREGRISPGCTGMYLPEHASAWKRIVDFVHHSSTSRIGLQLGHAGRKASTKLEWEGSNEPLEEGNWPILAPSPIPWSPRHQVPREMTEPDLQKVIQDHVRAAEMAIEAGFDMLELHMAHGYLLSSFFTPLTNIRTDQYGGTLENRMRFPLLVFDAVRKAWPQERPISVRISATDWVPGGLDAEDAVQISRAFLTHGCDLMDVSTGLTTPMAQPVYGRMFQAPFADRIRNEAGIPTMSVGNIQGWDHINTLIAAGACDLCALARPHLYDPYLTLHAATDQNFDIPWPDQYLPAKK